MRNSVLTSESNLRLTNGASKEGSSSSRIMKVFVEEEEEEEEEVTFAATTRDGRESCDGFDRSIVS